MLRLISYDISIANTSIIIDFKYLNEVAAIVIIIDSNTIIESSKLGLIIYSYNNFKYIITFLYNKTLRSNIYLLIDKLSEVVLIAFKIFLNNVEYNNL